MHALISMVAHGIFTLVTKDHQEQSCGLTGLGTHYNQGTHTAEAQGVYGQRKRQEFYRIWRKGEFQDKM